MQAYINETGVAEPIHIVLSFAEALTLMQVIANNVNMNQHYPIAMELYEKLERTVDDPYFD